MQLLPILLILTLLPSSNSKIMGAINPFQPYSGSQPNPNKVDMKCALSKCPWSAAKAMVNPTFIE